MTYRATENIYVGGVVLAYVPGDVVPDSAVENLDVHDKVKRDRRPRRASKPKDEETAALDES